MRVCVVLLSLGLLGTPATTLPQGQGRGQSRGQERLLMQASEVLAWAEEAGGRLITQMLLDQDVSDGQATFDPLVESLSRSYLLQLAAKVSELTAEVSAETDGGPRTRLGRARDNLDVILPNGFRLPGLDFNDILDILGDYGKGLLSLLAPVIGGRPRDAGADSVWRLQSQLQQQLEQLRHAVRR